MSYIRAKYPDTFRWYMRNETQGYGGGKGHNASAIVQIASRLSNGLITREVASDIFASATVADITSSNVQRVLNYSNTSLFLESASTLILNTLNSERDVINAIISSGSGNLSTVVSNIVERFIEGYPTRGGELEILKADMISRATYFEGEACLDDFLYYMEFTSSVYGKTAATIEQSIETSILSFINSSDMFTNQQDPSSIASSIVERLLSFTNDSLWVISQSNLSLTEVDTLQNLVNSMSGAWNTGQGNHSSSNTNTETTFNNTHDGLWAVAQNVSILLQNIIERLIEALHSSEWTNTQYTEVQELINEMSARSTYFESQECVEEVLTYLEFQSTKSDINNI
jgi:hypothetical protein